MSVGSSNCYPSHFHGNTSIETNLRRQQNCKILFECKAIGYSQTKATLKVQNLVQSNRHSCTLVKSYDAKTTKAVSVPEDDGSLENSVGGDGKFPPGNGDNGNGGGGGNSGDGDDEDEKEFGRLLKFDEVLRETEKHGATLPSDILEAAKTTGIRELVLMRYLEMQGSVWPLGFLIRHCSMLRNWMIADPAFLFKVGTEIVIDSCCATFAEVQKRGKDFWNEFELYAADLLVGVVVDIALVGMLAPYARIGRQTVSTGVLGRFQHACRNLPSSVFEAERPGCRFSVKQRIAAYFYKGILYGAVGFGCGIVGQGIANTIMTAKRSVTKSDDDVPVPPLVKSAALWGMNFVRSLVFADQSIDNIFVSVSHLILGVFFLAFSSNTRYQIVNGLERVVEASPLAKNVPPIAMAFTVGVRFANNIYGGMQFVDWAKWSGVQ